MYSIKIIAYWDMLPCSSLYARYSESEISHCIILIFFWCWIMSAVDKAMLQKPTSLLIFSQPIRYKPEQLVRRQTEFSCHGSQYITSVNLSHICLIVHLWQKAIYLGRWVLLQYSYGVYVTKFLHLVVV